MLASKTSTYGTRTTLFTVPLLMKKPTFKNGMTVAMLFPTAFGSMSYERKTRVGATTATTTASMTACLKSLAQK